MLLFVREADVGIPLVVDDELLCICCCPLADDEETVACSPDLTTSCLGSTLAGPLVRLIFILRPLSTDETWATLLLLIV